MPRQVHDPERTRRAARAYLDGGDLTIVDVARQYGISRSILNAAIKRARDGQPTNAGTAG